MTMRILSSRNRLSIYVSVLSCLVALGVGCGPRDSDDNDDSRGTPRGEQQAPDTSTCRGTGTQSGAPSAACATPDVCAGGDCRLPDAGSPDDVSEPPSDTGLNDEVDGGTDDAGDRTDVEPDPKPEAGRLVAQDVVRFGSIQPLPDSACDRATRLVTIRNVGRSDVELRGAQFQGKGDPFWITYPPAGDSEDSKNGGDKCGNRHSDDRQPSGDGPWPAPGIDETLEPSESLQIRVWFEPTTTDPVRSTLQFDWSDASDGASSETLEIDLIANAETPCLETTPRERLDFGQTTVGQEARQSLSFGSCHTAGDTPLKIENIELTSDGGGAFELVEGSLTGSLEQGQTLTIRDRKSRAFTLVFQPPGASRYAGELLIETNDPSRRRATFELAGRGTDNPCPRAQAEARGPNQSWGTDIQVPPLTNVKLRAQGTRDPDGTIARYEWSILKRPADSIARLKPNRTEPDPEIQLDMVGTYQFELVAYDDDGNSNCGQRAVVTVDAVPESDVYLQLTWTTPGDTNPADDKGTDLDLHYVRPTSDSQSNWNDTTNDIFWSNETADWGRTGDASDDPSLEIDDTNGRGPEAISHDNPSASKRYKIGVNYYTDRGLGPSYATVAVYFDQTLNRRFADRFLQKTRTFWYVGRLDWSNRKVIVRNQLQQGIPTSK